MPLKAHHHKHVGDVLQVPVVPVVPIALTHLVQLLHRLVPRLDVLPTPASVGVEAIAPEGAAAQLPQLEVLARDRGASDPILPQQQFFLHFVGGHVVRWYDVITRLPARGTDPAGCDVARPLLPPLHEAGVTERVMAAREYAEGPGRLQAYPANAHGVVDVVVLPPPSSLRPAAVVMVPELAVLAVPARSRREVGAGNCLQRLLARERSAGVVGEPARLAVPAVAVLEEESAERSRRGGAPRGGGGGRGDGIAAAASVAPLFVRHGIGVNGRLLSRESSVAPGDSDAAISLRRCISANSRSTPPVVGSSPRAHGGSKSEEVLLVDEPC